MSVLIGHARISESGTINGTKGDSTGKEVTTSNWYNHPWDYMAIHPDSNVREKHAKAIEQACDNDNIGYGQSDRNTLNTLAKAVGYDLSKVGKCNCDCSSLQNVAAMASGASGVSYGSNGWTTSTMLSKLKTAGYKIITDSAYLTNESYCVRGAIYVKSGSHTVTGLSNGSKYQETLKKIGSSSSSGNDSSFNGGTAVSYTARITPKEGLNVRKGPSTSYAVVIAIPYNKTIQITKESNGWGYTTYNGKSGWVSLEYTSKIGSSNTNTPSSNSPSYKVGQVYTLKVDGLRVRSGAGTNYSAKSYSQLTTNAQQNAYSNGCLKKGTEVTCKEVKNVGTDIWIKIPSGWVAAYFEGEVYIG